MPAMQILEYNPAQPAWEVRTHDDADGDLMHWHAVAVRDGGSEAHGLYQASSAGIAYQAETGDDDDGVTISVLALGKRNDTGAISMGHELYLRFEGVSADTLTITVTANGSEYGEISFDYDVDVAGSGNTEARVRLHRELLGRLFSVQIAGDVSNRPTVEDMRLRVIPVRSGRVTA